MMSKISHSISLGIENHQDHIYLYFKAVGKLTHDDYEMVVPMLESTLGEVRYPDVKALCDCSEFEGWELRAAWDDFKLGLSHGNAFSKIAVFGKPGWQKTMSQIANWFTSGEVRFFEDAGSARAWLCQPQDRTLQK